MFAAVGRAAPLGPHRATKARPSVPASVLLGARAVQRTVGQTGPGRAEAFSFAVHRAGTVSAISVYVDAHSRATKLIVALYSSRAGHPARRVASGALASPKAGAWNQVSVSRAAVSARNTYWIAVLGQGGTLSFRDRPNGSCRAQTYHARVAALPTKWATQARLNACAVSAYATGVPSTGATGATLTFGPLAPPATTNATTTNSGSSTPPPSTSPTPPSPPGSTPPPTPNPTLSPVNTAAPLIAGAPVQGNTLTVSTGTWSGSPTSYAYRWQDCDSFGASCADISGATSSSYVLASGDVGRTVRAVVAATNAGGMTSQPSLPSGVVTSGAGSGAATQVGGPTPAGVVCTRTLSPGANVQSVLSTASPGAVVCLNSGSWSAITLNGIAPASPGVTLAATPGQTVVVPGFTITGANTQNLTIEGFSITTPATTQTNGGNASNGFQLICGISGGVTLQYNTIENQSNGTGIYAFANSCGAHGYTQSGVTIQYNQIDHVATALEIDGGISEESNFNVSHNVIGPYIQYGGDGHYVQVQGISGLTMNNNAFEGPADPAYENCNPNGSASHLNVLHVDTGETGVTFDNNIIWHSQTCGDTVLIQDSPLDNIQIENNLDVEDPGCATMTPYSCDANPMLVQAPHGLTFEHNTVANAERGISLGGTSGTTYSSGQNMTDEYNIATPPVQYDKNFNLWKCSSSCATGDNASSDTSANAVLGGAGNVVSWTPSWTTTSWTPVSGPGYQAPPVGYYQPAGLAISGGGYQGQVGP